MQKYMNQKTVEQVRELGSYGYKTIVRARPPAWLSRFARFSAVNAVHLDRESRALTGVGHPRRNWASLGAGF
jgi:hypothetical protein